MKPAEPLWNARSTCTLILAISVDVAAAEGANLAYRAHTLVSLITLQRRDRREKVGPLAVVIEIRKAHESFSSIIDCLRILEVSRSE
jgi:hypothetical protein